MADVLSPIGFLVTSLLIVAVGLTAFVAVSRGLRVRVLAWVVAVVVWLATYLLLWGDESLWLVLGSSTLVAALAYLGVWMRYRTFKSSSRFPNVKW